MNYFKKMQENLKNGSFAWLAGQCLSPSRNHRRPLELEISKCYQIKIIFCYSGLIWNCLLSPNFFFSNSESVNEVHAVTKPIEMSNNYRVVYLLTKYHDAIKEREWLLVARICLLQSLIAKYGTLTTCSFTLMSNAFKMD